jgi:hypothetical protein
MAHISSSCPSIPVLVKNEFLHNQKEGFNQFTKGWVVAVRTIKGLAVTFYVLLENGVLFTGLPIHALCHKESAPMLDLGDLEMWDSLSYDHSIFQIDFLRGMACTVLLRNKEKHDGEYLFTIDFSNQTGLTGIAESPNEWKTFHFIKLKNGRFALYPQNRIIFRDASLTKATKIDTIKYQVNTTEWGCEDGNKWTVGYDSSYLYGVNRDE